MTLSIWQRTSRERPLTCDVAVVGGGIIGASTAYWLRRTDPELDVVILEAGRLAGGASGRNAGFLLQGTASDYATDIEDHGMDRARRLWHFSRENRELMLQELSPRSFEFEGSGSLTVAGSSDEDRRLQRCVSRMRADGFPAAYIPPDETNRRMMAKGFFGSLYVSSGAMLHPVMLVRHIVERSGARVLEHHRVVEVSNDESLITLETPVRAIRARYVVLCMNAYLPQLVPALGKFIRPVRAQMLATDRQPHRWLPVPVYSHEGYYYIRQRPDGSVLLGGARHLHRMQEQGYADETTLSLQTDLENFLHNHFPQTRDLAVQARWSGVMGFSPDGLPVVGDVPGIPGAIWGGGFTGHGMGYGFRFGRLLAEMLRRGFDAVDADLFDSRRFDTTSPASLRLASP